MAPPDDARLRADLFLTGDDLLRVLVGPRHTEPDVARPLADRVADFARRAGATVEIKSGSRAWIVEVQRVDVRRLHDRLAAALEGEGVEVEVDQARP